MVSRLLLASSIVLLTLPQTILGFAPPSSSSISSLAHQHQLQQRNNNYATTISKPATWNSLTITRPTYPSSYSLTATSSTALSLSIPSAFLDPSLYQHMGVGGILAFAGDLLAQSLLSEQAKKDSKISVPPKDWDIIRTAAFVVFGALYTGGAQHFIFNFLNGSFDEPLVRLALAQFFFIPFCYYPTFLVMTPALRAGWEYGFGSSEAKTRQSELFTGVASKIPSTLVRNWCFWLPVQYVQFNFIPVEYNVTFTAAFGVIWNAILSWSTASSTSSSTADVDVATEKKSS